MIDLEAVLKPIIDEALNTAREEQRETCAREVWAKIQPGQTSAAAVLEIAAIIRASPLDATPLAVRVRMLEGGLRTLLRVAGEVRLAPCPPGAHEPLTEPCEDCAAKRYFEQIVREMSAVVR